MVCRTVVSEWVSHIWGVSGSSTVVHIDSTTWHPIHATTCTVAAMPQMGAPACKHHLLYGMLCRRPGPEGMKAFTSFPWSPRWPAAEMAARIFNFLKQQLASCAEQLLGTAPTTAAAAGAGAAVPAAAAVPVAGVAGTVPGLLPAGVSSSSSSGVVPSPHVAASGSGEGAASPAAVPGAGTPPS